MQDEDAAQKRHLTDQAFADLPIHPRLLEALHSASLTHCTPIQAKTLPLALAGHLSLIHI